MWLSKNFIKCLEFLWRSFVSDKLTGSCIYFDMREFRNSESIFCSFFVFVNWKTAKLFLVLMCSDRLDFWNFVSFLVVELWMILCMFSLDFPGVEYVGDYTKKLGSKKTHMRYRAAICRKTFWESKKLSSLLSLTHYFHLVCFQAF